jgi:hypothetical protein
LLGDHGTQNQGIAAGSGGAKRVNLAPFIDGSYGVTVVFLIGIFALTYTRYRNAVKRLAAVDKN